MKPITKKSIVNNWLNNNYDYSFKTIRAIWYKMKPIMQEHDITDVQATRIIGQWLWSKFCAGNRDIYGAIGNSQRVKSNKLPIILFCEKNTLEPFDSIENHIYANSYLSSGQANLYEIANLINSIDEDEIYLYVATDFDKAGDDISASLLNHLSKFFTVNYKKLEVKIYDYETYVQPNGEDGLELDAVDDLQELIVADLESFLPYKLFEKVAINEKVNHVYQELLTSDDEHIDLLEAVNNSENRLWLVATNNNYDYCLMSDLHSLKDRVEVA